MTIDEKTKITLFSVAVALPTVVYVIVFIVGLSFKSEANAIKLEKTQMLMDAQTIMLLDIRDRLIKIEANQGRK